MTTALDGLATPLSASSGVGRAEHCPTCVLGSDAASLVDQPPLFGDQQPARVQRLSHGRVTLDELVSGAWAAVGAGAPAACPVCDGTLRRRAGGATAAECSRCGAELA